MSWFYYVGRGIMRMLLWMFTRWQVTGKENIPRQGPLVIVSNHINSADPPLLAVSINREALCMAKEELFRNPLAGYFMRRFGAFPVHRSRLDREALRQALQVLQKGQALIMFPEGMRSRTGQLRPAFNGAAHIACVSGAGILPVGIVGTDRIKGWSWLVTRPRIAVNIGRPFFLPAPGSRLTREELAEHTNSIMRHIAEVLPESYRGIYAHED